MPENPSVKTDVKEKEVQEACEEDDDSNPGSKRPEPDGGTPKVSSSIQVGKNSKEIQRCSDEEVVISRKIDSVEGSDGKENTIDYRVLDLEICPPDKAKNSTQPTAAMARSLDSVGTGPPQGSGRNKKTKMDAEFRPQQNNPAWTSLFKDNRKAENGIKLRKVKTNSKGPLFEDKDVEANV